MAAVGASGTAFDVEYEGSRYRGWQHQRAGVPPMQEALERALSRVAAELAKVTCISHTGATVHASGQAVHFNAVVECPLKTQMMGTNANLPADISVTWVRMMPTHFRARFPAMAQRYRYAIYNNPIHPVHLAEKIIWNHRPLDIGRMREVAQILADTHNSTSFQTAQYQAKSLVKTMHHVRLLEHGQLIVLNIRGNTFLHHMVRSIANVLATIGAGERPVEWAKEAPKVHSRCTDGVTAYPYGLYLMRMGYPGEFGLPERYLGPHFLSGLPNIID